MPSPFVVVAIQNSDTMAGKNVKININDENVNTRNRTFIFYIIILKDDNLSNPFMPR